MVITGIVNPGGISVINRLVQRSLLNEDFQIDIYSLNDKCKSELPGHLINSNTNLYRYGRNKIRFSISVLVNILLNKYMLVMCDHTNLASLLAFAHKFGFCNYIVWLNGIEVFPPKPDKLGEIGMKSASKCFAISKYTFAHIKNRYPDLPLYLCELALDPYAYPDFFEHNPDTAGKENSLTSVNGLQNLLGPQVILTVGRMSSLEKYKGQDYLIKAYEAVYDRFPDAQLVLVGDGDDQPRLQELAKRYPVNIQNNIFFAGFLNVEELIDLYRCSYMFVMPSSGEGFGLVYLEAMLYGKPCIGGNEDASSNLIVDGLTGYVVDPKSADAIAEKIIALLMDEFKAREMGKAGHEIVSSKYMFPHFKERFIELLEV